jgi:uncharacterized protein YbbK (DUF523 family)
MKKLKIGISSCLLGNKVRYDGNHKLDRIITETLGRFFQFIPFCPEVGSGLSIPREAMNLVGDPSSPRLLTTRTQIDLTERLISYTEATLNSIVSEDLCGFIFKSKSPSCGLFDTNVIAAPNGSPTKKSIGLFAAAFTKKFPLVPVTDEKQLQDLPLREKFIEQVFAFSKCQSMKK